ncbi:MAG: hypothetical protein BGO57_04245 [Sphingomonadales bacterium 63-6]|nr:MAG: hypothetical protein BGO57_04245 [Sphingomonadales bacterium 63-6]
MAKDNGPKNPAAGPSDEKSSGSTLAGLALRHGAKLARRSIDKRLSIGGISAGDVDSAFTARSLVGTIALTAATRLATRSVPGALVVGSGLVAKALYERHKRKRDEAEQAAQAAPVAEKSAKKTRRSTSR